MYWSQCGSLHHFWCSTMSENNMKFPQHLAAQMTKQFGRRSVSVLLLPGHFSPILLALPAQQCVCVWLFLFCLQCRSLSNQYWNGNISPFHAECCTAFRESAGGSRMNFLIFCLWSGVTYYYCSNLSIVLTKEEGTFHANLIALLCRKKCSHFLLIAENVIHPSNCQTLPTRQMIDRFYENEF